MLGSLLFASFHSSFGCSSHGRACLAHFAHTPRRHAVSIIEGSFGLTDVDYCLVRHSGWLSSVGKLLAPYSHRWTEVAHAGDKAHLSTQKYWLTIGPHSKVWWNPNFFRAQNGVRQNCCISVTAYLINYGCANSSQL